MQFYEDDEFLCDVVARYLGAGLAEGDSAVVVATQEHWESIGRRMTENGFDLPRASSSGRLRFLDARETLERILQGEVPDPVRFQHVVGSLVRAQPGSVRAFGEMVDLLWRAGNLTAALSLEEM
ncbi:MAG TPA: MEDS domain-containing protein, partial [Polyangiaceae bacterium]|nr:MEDS domain-containing protein [Polyangiaceae bacterium]